MEDGVASSLKELTSERRSPHRFSHHSAQRPSYKLPDCSWIGCNDALATRKRMSNLSSACLSLDMPAAFLRRCTQVDVSTC
jgi:hypothetical protein